MGAIRDDRTKAERGSDRELVVSRTFDAPARIVYEAWTRPDLFKQWWAPKSSGVPLLSVEQDVRVGGGYRVVFGRDASQSMAFYGKYIEVVPNARLAWTNDEGEEGAVTTVTFEETDGKTLLVLRELYPTKEALDAFVEGMGPALEGMEGGLPEQFNQLDELLAALGAGRS
jgi:uncharacterized protein YndB with AHSA1/START domain